MSEVKNNLYQTAALVTALSVAERFLGFLYRIILSRTIGSEGMGLYQIALSVFAVFVTISTSGIPITLSRVITKHKAEGDLRGERSSVTAAVVLTLAFCIPVSLVMFFGHDAFSFLFSDSRAENIFIIMLSSLTFNSVYAVLRGSFWGNRQFLAYSLIELVEEVVMVCVGTFLVVKATDILSGTRRAAIAVVVSYITSFTIAGIYFIAKGGRPASPKGEYRPLLSSALPITAMRTSNSLINSLVAVLLPQRLTVYGMSSAEALSEFGVAVGMAMPVLSMPSTLIGSISLVLVPELSENFYAGKHKTLKKNIETAIRTTVLIACLLIPFLFVYGRDIGLLIYSNEKSGEMIAASCLMLLPMSLSMISTSMLNSLHLEKQTLVFYLMGSALLILSIAFLPKYIGTYALVVGMAASFTVTALLNLRLLHKRCVYKPKFVKHLLLSCACMIPCAGAGFTFYSLFNKLMPTFFSMLLSGAILLAFALLLFAVLKLIPREATEKFLPKKKKILSKSS